MFNLTCARSPSYLNSQVKAAFSNRLNTSSTPLEGWANMGFSGIPLENKINIIQFAMRRQLKVTRRLSGLCVYRTHKVSIYANLL